MKRIAIFALLAALLVAVATTENLAENEFYRKSIELKAAAEQAFEEGEYDAAADYAAQAQEYSVRSDAYVEKMLAKSAAEKSMASAAYMIDKATKAGADALAPAEIGAARESSRLATEGFASESYTEARTRAEEAARTASTAYDLSRTSGENAVAAARDRIAWADSVDAKANWPAEYEKAKAELEIAVAALGVEDYATAKEHADAVILSLAGIKGAQPWPAIYIVRLILERRDCLWRIAEYPFIYGDPLMWPKIYEANKKTFRDPSNPNLIYPGQKLVIPNIAGEEREGTWDPAKVYPPFKQ